jgi:hypothetical protein
VQTSFAGTAHSLEHSFSLNKNWQITAIDQTRRHRHD